MKKFEAPEIEIVRFKVEDIITESNEMPLEPFSELRENELTITKIG